MFSKHNTATQNLNNWREVRQNLNHNSTIEDVLEHFTIQPERTRYIDYYTPANWPNVFEIVNESMFCQSGITLVLAATLAHIELINPQLITLDVVSNHISGTEGLVLKHNNLYYNFMPGEISSVEYVKENGVLFDSHIITVDKLFR